jgi:hypothetical protein
MNCRGILFFAILLSIFAFFTANAPAACEPVGTWAGILNSDTQPGGVLSNWTFSIDGLTSGEWIMFTTDGGTVSSSDASGMWICFGGEVLATYTGMATESVGGTQSGYTLEFHGPITGDTAAGQYTITFGNPLWEGDTGTWNLARDAVSNHVSYIEITAGLDYEDPFITEDLMYGFNFSISTDDTVSLVEFLDPTGTTHQIPMISEQWDDVNKVWTFYSYDPDDDSYSWNYEKQLPNAAALADYDGQYTITVHYVGGGQQQTTAWFGAAGTSNPIPQPTQEPILTSPAHRARVKSPVPVTWQACTDDAASSIYLVLQDETSGADEDYQFDKTATGFETPLTLTDGPWQIELYFVAGDSGVNPDGIETFFGKYSTSDYDFTVASSNNISGTVVDRDTSSPMDNMRVGLHHEDLWQWFETRTLPDGSYLLSDIPDGTVQVQALPEPDSGYARTGRRVDLSGDVTGLRFELAPGSTYSGRLVDAQTAEPIGGIEVGYWNDAQVVWQSSWVDANGRFSLPNLPAGLASLTIEPSVNTGYAKYLQWESSQIHLEEGQEYVGRIIGLQKGVYAYGYVFYPDGTPAAGVELDYDSRTCGGNVETGSDGFYEMILPPDTYVIAPDTDELGAVHTEITVNGGEMFVPIENITIYPLDQGGQISGIINNPGSLAKEGVFTVVAFEPGTVFSPDTWYTIRPVAAVNQPDAGPFTLAGLPPGTNYDIYLVSIDETDDEVESGTILDSELNVSIGTTDVSVDYTTEGGAVTGQVRSMRQKPLYGVQIMLADTGTGDFAGFADTDANGTYTFYNIPAGTYTVIAMHGKYQNASTAVAAADGQVAQADTLILPYLGEKEGADLDGDGVIGIGDAAILADQWLLPGSTANFDLTGVVDLGDFSKLLENWGGEAIWPH